MTLERIRSPQLPSHLNGRVLTDDRGAPRYWATVWEALHGADLSDSTLAAKLLAIDRLYRSVREQTGADCLDRLRVLQFPHGPQRRLAGRSGIRPGHFRAPNPKRQHRTLL